MSPEQKKTAAPFRAAEIYIISRQSEINIVDRGVSKLKFLLGYSLQRRVNKLFAGVVSLYIAHFRAFDLIPFTGSTKLAVFAGGLDIVAEQLFLCHKKFLQSSENIII